MHGVQGHALYTRQAGSTVPCPYVDYDKGFNAVFARAYGLEDGETISKLFGKDWGKAAQFFDIPKMSPLMVQLCSARKENKERSKIPMKF